MWPFWCCPINRVKQVRNGPRDKPVFSGFSHSESLEDILPEETYLLPPFLSVIWRWMLGHGCCLILVRTWRGRPRGAGWDWVRFSGGQVSSEHRPEKVRRQAGLQEPLGHGMLPITDGGVVS